jgi:hypothetical protein
LVEPGDQRGQDQPKRQRVEHGARVYTTDPISGPQDPRPSNETIRASGGRSRISSRYGRRISTVAVLWRTS